MFVLKVVVFAAACACVASQQGPTTTPVPILKQINTQNDDGSYSYGYEAADGSFKIETKYPSGDVAGKYGYVDETGKVREVSYGASSQRGFVPEGTGIMVPPPTLNNAESHNALTEGQEDDGQYREDPKIYEDAKYNGRAQTRPAAFKQYQRPVQQEVQQKAQPQTFQSQTYQQPQYEQQQYQQPQYQQPQYQQQQYQQPQYQQQTYQPQPQANSQFQSPTPLRSNLFSQQTDLVSQSPQQFPQSQVYHQQPQFSYQAYTPQPYQSQNYQNQNYQNQNFNPFTGHPAQNFDPNTGSYSINFTG